MLECCDQATAMANDDGDGDGDDGCTAASELSSAAAFGA
jgi:hypothetical protein